MRLTELRAGNELAPAEAVQGNIGERAGLSEERPDLCGAVREKRVCEDGDDAQEFGGGPENGGFALGIGIGRAEGPGLLGGEIFVREGDDGPDGFEGSGKFHFVEAVEDFADGGLRFFREELVLRLECRGLGNFSAETLFDHGGGATGEIAVAVGEVAVVAGDECVVAEVAVVAEGDFAQQEITECVHAEHVDDGARKDNVALGLAHLRLVHEEPAVGPDLFREGEHGGHEERGPVDGVKTDDVFADDVEIGGPVATLFEVGAADGAEISGEGVEPDVEDVRFFAGNGECPSEWWCG